MKLAPIEKPSAYKNINASFDKVNVSLDRLYYDWETMPRKIDIPPNKTCTIKIDCRVIKCLGKILLGVFIVPVVTVLSTLVGFALAFPICYYHHIQPNLASRSIGPLLLTPIICLFVVMPAFMLIGFCNGVIRSVIATYNWSTKPLELLLTEVKDNILNTKSLSPDDTSLSKK